jgi:spore maturation protein CgeB
MYDVIKAAKVVLNIHADSSPIYASNMRLFETTGIGSCLLTDWKINMNELFKEDTEAVTFRSEQDCVDKAKWLLSHDEERNNIALAGQRRVFSSHLYEHRLPEFLDIIKKHLK